MESWAGWVRGKGRVVPWCGGPHHCYGTAPLLLREPTLYYALHSPGHTHACTATPLFDGNPGRECSPHYQMFARVAKLRVSQNLGGHHLDGGQLRELQIWALRSCHPPLGLWLKLTALVLSCWHFLGGVSVLVQARLCLLGRMLGSCIQHSLDQPAQSGLLARMLCLSRTCLSSPRTMS